MRVVDVCPFYSPQGGGVKTYVERKLEAGTAAGHEIIIVAPARSDGSAPAEGGSGVVTLASPAFPLDRRYHYFSNERPLQVLLDRLQPDIVEASSPWASSSMVARWSGRSRRILVMHADPLSAYAYRWFDFMADADSIDRVCALYWRHLRRLDAAYDLIVSPGRSLAARLVRRGLKNVVLIPLGVEANTFSPLLRDEALRARLLARCELGSDATLLIGMGRLAAEKRWPLVIEAVAAAGYEHPMGLILLGDGPDRARVLRAAGYNPHIQLLAPVLDRHWLATILASADGLVHGCEAETFCLAAAEAKASGLPLIVPDRGGAFDQFRAGPGVIWKGGSRSSLLDALHRFATEDPQAQRRRAASVADHVPGMAQHFSKLFATYEKLLCQTSQAA